MMLDRSIRPIETTYNGIRFRSRLEARWAIFMDALSIKWEYEPEGFTDGNLSYLPDFWLPELKCYFEVKPNSPSDEEGRKANLVTDSGKDLYFAIGRPMRREDTSHGGSLVPWGGDVGDEKWDFVHCDNCNSTTIVWTGKWDEMECCRDATPNRQLHDFAVFAANNYRFGASRP